MVFITGFSKDRFPLVCPLAKEDGFICPGMNSFDGCSVYNNDGILLRKRIGSCTFKNLRKPDPAIGIIGKKKFVNPLKASKRSVKKT